MITKLQREIASAISTGLGGATVTRDRNDLLVTCDGFEEPIRVVTRDVILPDWAKPLASGIMLDVRAILAA